ncbi:MAG: PHA/PHB synthase family protein [Methyloligellaceae bacterium]
MDKSNSETTAAPSPEKLAEDWMALATQSQGVVQAFFERQDTLKDAALIDMEGVSNAFLELGQKMMADPMTAARAQLDYWKSGMALWQSMIGRMAGQETEPVARPERGDRRFADKAWNEELVFDYLKQSYLLTSDWVHSVVQDVDGLDERERAKVDFYTRQFMSAMAPSNFAVTNPVVLRETVETKGENLLSGLKHMLDDMERGKGRLKISMTDESAFELGKNVAATPGKVVYQNELMQLIQYEPTTPEVHKRPLLFVPPWINKFYILDLQPKNSLIKWAVDQGHTLFVISWANPSKELSDKSFTNYMLEGPMAALDAIEKATGEKSINLLGFCIGGILCVAMLAYMAAKGDKRIKSATFLTTMVDLEHIGEASVFIDRDQLAQIEAAVDETGYLEGRRLASIFNMMRENDLIWSFVVNNYLRGREPMAFDLLYWNSDSTALPAKMLSEFLRRFYLDNGLTKPGHIELDGVPIDIGKIKVPSYLLSTKEDHIAPWTSCFPATRLFSGPVRFVLGASGHIAGVINPPAKKKYCYWTNNAKTTDPLDWFSDAQQHEGSWWTDWGAWLGKKGGEKVPARRPGDGALKPIEEAPGSYVKVRAPE